MAKGKVATCETGFSNFNVNLELFTVPCTHVASDLLAIDWMFEMLAMACSRSFNMLNILISLIFTQFSL